MNLTIGQASNCYRQIIQTEPWHLDKDTSDCQVSQTLSEIYNKSLNAINGNLRLSKTRN